MESDAARRLARYIYFSDAGPLSQGPVENTRVAWRLVAANNRPLGRSAIAYPTLADCVASTNQLRAALDQTVNEVTFDSIARCWGWTVSLGAEIVAMRAHAYSRRLECIRAVDQFLAAAAVALSQADVLQRIGPRAMTAYPIEASVG